jgi:nucleoside-diphosphate-sugar epimerase
MKVFVTGATGVIGRRVVPLLVAQGHAVTGVARSESARAWLQAAGARATPLDLFDVNAVRGAFTGHDAVINLATHMPGSAAAMLIRWNWRENDRLRRTASDVMTRAAAEVGVPRFVQESFAPVYEHGGARGIDETWPQRPAPYNRTVLDAERAVSRFTERGGAGVALRFAGFYGPDDVLSEMLGVVKKGWSPLPGRPDAYWSSVSHDDAAAAVVASLGVPAGAYNVCDDEPLTRREFADVIAEAIGARRPRMLPAWLSALGGRTTELLSRSLRVSNAKLKAASGWTPSLASARTGLPRTLAELNS